MSRDLGPPTKLPPPSQGEPIATVGHQGRFWDVFLELDDDPRRIDVHRGLLCFTPSDLNEGERPARTGVILVEPTYEDLVRKAKSFEDHQLVGLLRSALPD